MLERKLFLLYFSQLFLSGSKIGNEGAAELTKVLAANRTLTTVECTILGGMNERCGIRQLRGGYAHMQAVPNDGCLLHGLFLRSAQLSICDGHIGDAGAVELAKLLVVNRTLTTVFMHRMSDRNL